MIDGLAKKSLAEFFPKVLLLHEFALYLHIKDIFYWKTSIQL
jgi:hypothetical protein